MTAPVPASEDRLDAIQALRGIAAVMVMFSHLWIIELKYSPDQLLGQFAEFGMIGVDIFFVISGFIMVYVTRDVEPSPQEAGRFLFSRITRIYPIYWIVSFALFLVWVLKPDIVFSAFDQSPDILKSTLLWPDDRPPLLAVGWTLIHEVFFYLIFTISLLFAKRLLLPFLTGWAAVTMLGYAGGLAGHSAETALLFSPLTLEFVAGAMAAWVFIRVDGKMSGIALSTGALGFILALAILAAQNYTMPTLPWLRTLYFAAPAALLVYGLAGLSGPVPARMIRLGDWSYSLYLTHILTLSLLGKLWQNFASPGILDNFVMLILFSGISIIVAGLCWNFIEAPLLAISKKIRQQVFNP